MKIKSNNQMMFQPKIKRIKPQTQWPSVNRVAKPSTHEVNGMMAKIKLTIQINPK